MTQPANAIPPKPATTPSTAASEPAVAQSTPVAGAAATEGTTAPADSGAATKPPEPPKVDAGAAKLAADQRSFERRMLQGKQELQRAHDQLAQQRREFEQQQRILLDQLKTPEAPAKPLPAEVQSVIDAQAAEISALKQWRDEQIAGQRRSAQTSAQAQAVAVFERETLASKLTTPLTSALAAKDPKRLERMAVQIARTDNTLSDVEIRGMIEEELGFYAGLKESPPPPKETAAPSDSTTPVKTPSGTATQATKPADSATPPKLDDKRRLSETTAEVQRLIDAAKKKRRAV